MIYLLRVVNRAIHIAVCEDASRVPALEAKGYAVVDRELFIEAWAKRDWMTTMDAINALPRPQPQARAVGDSPYVPSGFKLFHVKKGSE